MANIDKRLQDLENKLAPGDPDEVIIVTWGEDDRITVKRRPLAPGEKAEPGVFVDWSVTDEQPKQEA